MLSTVEEDILSAKYYPDIDIIYIYIQISGILAVINGLEREPTEMSIKSIY